MFELISSRNLQNIWTLQNRVKLLTKLILCNFRRTFSEKPFFEQIKQKQPHKSLLQKKV